MQNQAPVDLVDPQPREELFVPEESPAPQNLLDPENPVVPELAAAARNLAGTDCRAAPQVDYRRTDCTDWAGMDLPADQKAEPDILAAPDTRVVRIGRSFAADPDLAVV